MHKSHPGPVQRSSGALAWQLPREEMMHLTLFPVSIFIQRSTVCHKLLNHKFYLNKHILSFLFYLHICQIVIIVTDFVFLVCGLNGVKGTIESRHLAQVQCRQFLCDLLRFPTCCDLPSPQGILQWDSNPPPFEKLNKKHLFPKTVACIPQPWGRGFSPGSVSWLRASETGNLAKLIWMDKLHYSGK